MRTLYVRTTVKALAAVTVFSVTSVYAQSGVPDYSRFAPVYELARRLEARYARPVTVEEPLLSWQGEMERISSTPAGVEILGPRAYSLVLPKDDSIFNAPAISAELVRQALDVYHRQNPNRARYQVLESPMGFHIVPVAAHDDSGAVRSVKGLLDTPVEVLSDQRTATEHVQALLEAVSRSTGIPFRQVYNFDGRYAANGYLLRSGFPTPQDRPYRVFQWGASEVTAREALIDLLGGSATTMTWYLFCVHDATRGNQQICNLGVDPLALGENRTDLYLDRCTKCRLTPK